MLYFLKFPMIKEKRDYSAENWSEIIAYEVGTELGFNVLEYTLAVHNGRVGCISPNMIDTSTSTLIEGYSILVAHDDSYNPEDKESYSQYTFQFVCDALRSQNFGNYIPEFIKILIFDAIIGNSDRHQGNWGFIQTRVEVGDKNSNSRPVFFKRKKNDTTQLYIQ